MNHFGTVLVRQGRRQSMAALAMAGLATLLVMAVEGPGEVPGRLIAVGAAVLTIALAAGSARLVGVSTLPMLGGAWMATIAPDDPAWARSIVLGCVIYVAAELAWDAIERRDGVERTAAFNDRRLHEVATVVTVSLAIAGVGYLMAFLAPTRRLLPVGLVALGLLTGLSGALSHVRRVQSESESAGVSGQ